MGVGLLGTAWDIEHAIFVDEVKHRVVDDKQAIGRDARHHSLQSLAILECSVADVPYSAAYGERLESFTTGLYTVMIKLNTEVMMQFSHCENCII